MAKGERTTVTVKEPFIERKGEHFLVATCIPHGPMEFYAFCETEEEAKAMAEKAARNQKNVAILKVASSLELKQW